MDPVGYIYKTTNLINQSVYIGQHKRSEKSLDKRYYGSGKILLKAIKKHGKENFSCEILCWCFSQDELDKREIQFISEYKKTHKSYNIAKGGNGGNLILHYTEEEKRKVYEKMIETRKKNRIGFGSSNPMYRSGERGIHPRKGKKLNLETRIKISKSLKGHTPWNKGMKKEKEEISYKERYLKNKCKVPIKITNLETNISEFFESRGELLRKYPNLNYKIGLKKESFKGYKFENITKEEYLYEVKRNGQTKNSSKI